jgi:hypothetical protein
MKGTILHLSPSRKRKQQRSAHESLMSSPEAQHSPKAAASSRSNSKKHQSFKHPISKFLTMTRKPTSPKRHWVKDQFKTIETEEGVFSRCNHCNTEGRTIMLRHYKHGGNITRHKSHLMNKQVCSFLSSEEARALAKSVPELKEDVFKPGLKLLDFGVEMLGKSEQHNLHLSFAKMMIVTAMPFMWVEHDAVRDFSSS